MIHKNSNMSSQNIVSTRGW